MSQYKQAISLLFLMLLAPLSVFAYSIGEKIHYQIILYNNSAETIVANGQAIAPQISGTVGDYNDEIKLQQSEFSHPVTVTSQSGMEICTVTGNLSIGVPGSFKMSGVNTNTGKCSKLNGMNGMSDLYLQVTVS